MKSALVITRDDGSTWYPDVDKMRTAAFDEAAHPRNPAGSSDGGKFTTSPGGPSTTLRPEDLPSGVVEDRPAPFLNHMLGVDKLRQLSVEKRAKLFDAFSTIDTLLKDPDIGPQLWETLSSFTPESLRDRVEAMRTNTPILFHVPEAYTQPVYRFKAQTTVDEGLQQILTAMADPDIGPLIEQLILKALKTNSWQAFTSPLKTAGSEKSGNYGHSGRPGEVGGSGPGGADRPWTDPGGFSHTGITWKQPTDLLGRPVPIQVKTVAEAIPLVLAGKVVEVPDAGTAATLINRLSEMAIEAEKAGKKAQNYDLCQVSVAGSNMFCGEVIKDADHPNGYSRIEMPQIGGKPIPGSEAAKFPPGGEPGSGEVDGAQAFITFLQGTGMRTAEETIPASRLKASQREMKGLTVGGIMRNKSYDPAAKPIFISSDNYIVDGHHRWAAVVGRDARDGSIGESMMHVVRVNAPISEVLHIANAWSTNVGIQQAPGVTRQAKATGLRAAAQHEDMLELLKILETAIIEQDTDTIDRIVGVTR